MMNITIEKKHEGTTVYGLGTGNNRPRGGRPNDPVPFVVVKVKRKYVSLKTGWSHREVNYHPTNGATQECINSGYSMVSGYMFFESLECIEKYKRFRNRRAEVMEFFRGIGVDLTEEQVYAIHSILFDDNKQD